MAAVLDSKPKHITDAEWAVRVDLAAAYRLVDMNGWSDGIGTHISARVPGPEDHFLLNPYGLLFDEITASSLIKVDLDGNALDESDYQVNPAGFVIHSAVHMSNPELECVLHTHTTAGTSVATQKDGLLPINQHALQVLYTTAYHDYEGPATDHDERARIVSDLADNRVLILRNHGLLTVGRTIAEAFVWMYRAERACRMQLAFQQCGAELHPITEEVQALSLARSRHFQSDKGHRPTGKLEWPAWLRKLDKFDTSYKH
ncbi:MAG: class II aldolase/adducin family protein [Gammaproteobacteria bacterium]|nr:class II aldolase/adducin family protein [Gammaproteobacteria bacterium]